MKKIAIYARYSSDNQNEKSIDDQILECKRYIKNNFITKDNIAVFSDKALSGRNSIDRKEYKQLKETIERRNIDILIADTLDRLGRNLEDLSNLYKICEYYNVNIFTIQDGKITLMHIGFKGTMSDMFIDNLGHQVRRSQRSRASEGKMFGLPYGYKIKIKEGREVKGERVINKKQAEIVRFIFQMYADRHSMGSIVQILNARGILSPKKSKWTRQSLMGSLKRKEGILNNDIYRGKVIWNMKSKRINPKTGGKNYFMNPENEWVITNNNNLRIVSDELWAKCSIRKYEKNSNQTGKSRRIRRINPLRSLIFCGVCGSKKNLANNKRYVCSNFKYHKTCTNGRGINFNKLIELIFQRFTEELEKFSEISLTHNFQNKIDQENSKKTLLKQEYNNVTVKINKTITLLDSDIELEEISERLRSLKFRRSEITAKLEKTDIGTHTKIHPILSKSIKKLKDDLFKIQENDECHIQLLILIKNIYLYPTDKYQGETAEIQMMQNAWIDYYRFLQNE